MPDTGLDLSPGTTLVAKLLNNSGVVQVEDTEERDGQEFVKLSGRGDITLRLPLEETARLLRPPVPKDQAKRWLATLRNAETVADERPFSQRYPEYEAVLAEGASDELVDTLRRLYASRYAPARGDKRLISLYEQIAVGEIVHVLDLAEADLVEELHAIHAVAGTFAPDAPERPA